MNCEVQGQHGLNFWKSRELSWSIDVKILDDLGLGLQIFAIKVNIGMEGLVLQDLSS